MRIALIPLLAVTLLPACERGDTDEAVKRLSDIDKRMARMERKLDQIAAGRPAGAARGAAGQGPGQTYHPSRGSCRRGLLCRSFCLRPAPRGSASVPMPKFATPLCW